MKNVVLQPLQKKKKGYLQISFAWLFALIVGVFILFLAIYFGIRLIGSGQYEVNTKTAKQIEVLLDPLEIGYESLSVNTFSLPVETKIYPECEEPSKQENEDYFGWQKISLTQKSFGKWPEPGVAIKIPNKYVFSKEVVQGEDFIILSMPFEFPFKVADINVLVSKDEGYCFIDVPTNLKSKIDNFGMENIKTEDCEYEEKVRVCFSNTLIDCDVEVFYDEDEKQGYVKKDGGKSTFVDDGLMFAAIFSEKGVYECQIERLMRKTGSLYGLYNKKAEIVSEQACVSGLGTDLVLIEDLASNVESSSELNSLNLFVEKIENRQESEGCELW